MKNNNWAKNIQPIDLEKKDHTIISQAVREQIKKSEKGVKVKMNKRFKTLLVAAVIAVTAAVSAVSVNAATDGALMEKVKFIINGEEKDMDAVVTKNENGDITYEIQADDSDSVKMERVDEIDNTNIDK